MLYLHGGGFVFGSPVFYRRLAAQLSAASGMPVLVLDYRLAPEHPFPAAADDAIAAYRWLLGDGYRPERLVVAGDSAGGHLVAGLLADIARGKLPMPAAAAMLSPFLDLTGEELDERDRARRDPFVPPDYARACAKVYAGAAGISQKRLNVLKARKRGWPPTLIQVGDTECLLGDSQRMADSLRASGVPCELQVWPGQVHVFHWFTPFIPEATAAIRYAGEFLRNAGEQRAAA
jgi:monoterpene epsilon-lactone hydrolase